jgi:DNA-binding MarR family transcriptional regulator
MAEVLEPAKLEAWRSFLRLHATLIDLLERDLARAGVVPLSWYDVLVALVQAPERRLRMHELAEAMVLNRSSVTRLVDRLEEAGLLTRQPTPGDRRGAFAVLTEQGLEALRTAWPFYANGIDQRFGRQLSESEATTITEAFRRLLAEAKNSSA